MLEIRGLARKSGSAAERPSTRSGARPALSLSEQGTVFIWIALEKDIITLMAAKKNTPLLNLETSFHSVRLNVNVFLIAATGQLYVITYSARFDSRFHYCNALL